MIKHACVLLLLLLLLPQDLETEMRELPGRYGPEAVGCMYVVYPASSGQLCIRV